MTHGVVINPSKCMFGVAQLQFLGHQVVPTPSRRKCKSLVIFFNPPPSINFTSFWINHRFLPNRTDTLHPLNKLLSTSKGNTKTVLWSENATAAFATIKEDLANATLLSHPKPDASTSIMTDASDIAVGAVLQQYIGNDCRPISYFSKKLKPAES